MFNWERIRGMNLREGERGPGDRGWVAGLRQTGRGNTGHCAGSWVWGSGRWRGWPGSSAWEPSGSFRAERRVSCPCLISSFLSAGWRLLKEEVRERLCTGIGPRGWSNYVGLRSLYIVEENPEKIWRFLRACSLYCDHLNNLGLFKNQPILKAEGWLTMSEDWMSHWNLVTIDRSRISRSRRIGIYCILFKETRIAHGPGRHVL